MVGLKGEHNGIEREVVLRMYCIDTGAIHSSKFLVITQVKLGHLRPPGGVHNSFQYTL